MRLLLDSHVFLWWRDDSPEISDHVRREIGGAEAAYVSAASVWELAIKASLGKLKAPTDMSGAIAASGFAPLPVTTAHAEGVRALPFHHADPFDRMLVAQALAERLVVVTRDRSFAPYPAPILWA